jgi:hypothetical protein
MDNERTQDERYSKPVITDHGDLTELTAGLKSGASLDASYNIHTPKSKLTFTTP